MENNNSKGIIIAILSVLLVGVVIYIGYDKLFNQEKKVDGNTITNTTINNSNQEENSKKDNTDTQTTNLYSIYSSNLKSKILNNATDFFEVGTGRMYDKNVYVALLNKKLELIIRIDKKQFNSNLLGDYNVAKNVIGFTIAQTGPGGEANVYFIKEDGTVGCAKVGQVFSSGKETIEVVDNFLNLKDIVSIVQTSHDNSGFTQEPIFIDINGNVFKNTDSAWD